MKLIDLKTLAENMSISIFTCRKYIKQGMPAYRIRRKILVDVDEVRVWLDHFRESASRSPIEIEAKKLTTTQSYKYGKSEPVRTISNNTPHTKFYDRGDHMTNHSQNQAI